MSVIVILHEPNGKTPGETIASTTGHLPPYHCGASGNNEAAKGPGNQSWDDLLIVPYDETGLSMLGR